jgi:hypothetical protein
MDQFYATRKYDFALWAASNMTASSFVTPAASSLATLTTANAVSMFLGNQATVGSLLRILPVFAVATEDLTTDLNIVGWSKDPSGTYIPTVLAGITITSGPGVVVATSKYGCKTIALRSGYGTDGLGVRLISRANGVSEVLVDTMGSDYVTLQGANASGSTAFNAYYKVV